MTGLRFTERLDPEVAAVLDGLPRYDLDDIVEARRRRKELAAATRALAAPNPDVVVRRDHASRAGARRSRGAREHDPGCRESTPVGCSGCTAAGTSWGRPHRTTG